MTKEGILKLHAVMLESLGLPYFTPAATDLLAWEWFAGVLDSLAETPGGPFTPADVRKVIGNMRRSNAKGESKWSLRLTTILRNPENFRDMVLESRRVKRPRAAVVTAPVSRAVGDGDSVTVLGDLRKDAEPVQVSDSVREFMEEFRQRKERKKA